MVANQVEHTVMAHLDMWIDLGVGAVSAGLAVLVHLWMVYHFIRMKVPASTVRRR